MKGKIIADAVKTTIASAVINNTTGRAKETLARNAKMVVAEVAIIVMVAGFLATILAQMTGAIANAQDKILLGAMKATTKTTTTPIN